MTDKTTMLDNLMVLVDRFLAAAAVRERRGLAIVMETEDDSRRDELESIAASVLAYRKCAEELERVLTGEIPPPPNKRWEMRT